MTRPARIAADLLAEREDPEAVGQVVADALRAGQERRESFETALAPLAARYAHPRGDGAAVLRWRALTDRLRAMAGEGRWTLPQLQRQVAYDRLLQRLYLVDDGWVVKGATALMARDLGARATIDIDLYRVVESRSVEEDVRAAAAWDRGDWFRFEIGPGPADGRRRPAARESVRRCDAVDAESWPRTGGTETGPPLLLPACRQELAECSSNGGRDEQA